jgi:hypothetical protein
MHLEFREPNVSNAEYLAELKAILIESAGGRLPLPDARIRLRDYLRASGYTPSKGFPDDAPGKWIPVASGSIDDLISPERLDWTLKHQMEVLYGARDKYAGNDPHRLDSFPGWMLMKRAGANADDLRDRWKRAGGAFYQPLLGGRCPDTEETGMIALKNDPVWARLGSSSLFSDAVDIDHPPFYLNSGLCCKEVDRWELEEMGILSTEARMSKDNSLDPAIRHAFERSTGIGLIPENRERILEVIRLRRMTRKAERYKLAEEAVQKASEAYAKSNNSEAELARAMERRVWHDLLDFAAVVHSRVSEAAGAGDGEKIAELEIRIRDGLRHERASSKPKICGALRRALGRIEEFYGRIESARAEYLFALNHDPKAGCQRDVKRLGKGLEDMVRS